MNRLPHFILFIVLLSAFSACDKNDISPNATVDWSTLKNGVIDKDNSKVGPEISKLLTGSEPDPTGNDEIGQKANIEKLIREINKSSVLVAELICYACIETLPPQTEIRLTALGGVPVTRVIDISTHDDGILKYSAIHD